MTIEKHLEARFETMFGQCGTDTSSPTSTLTNYVDPEIEAFFIALALQHGIGPSKLQPINKAMTSGIQYGDYQLRVGLREILMAHPGKPVQFQHLLRAQQEIAGRLFNNSSQRKNETWFWDNMVEAMIRYLVNHYKQTGHM